MAKGFERVKSLLEVSPRTFYFVKSLNRIVWFVYIIQCKDGSFYTGITNNLKRRLLEHKEGKGGVYTRKKKVEKMLYHE